MLLSTPQRRRDGLQLNIHLYVGVICFQKFSRYDIELYKNFPFKLMFPLNGHIFASLLKTNFQTLSVFVVQTDKKYEYCTSSVTEDNI